MNADAETIVLATGIALNIIATLYLSGVKNERRFTALETKMGMIYDSFIKRNRKDH